MFRSMTIDQFETWLQTEDNPETQTKAVASFVGSFDFIGMDSVKRDITCHYLANLVLGGNVPKQKRYILRT